MKKKPQSFTKSVALLEFKNKEQYDRGYSLACEKVIFFRNKVYPNEFIIKMFLDDRDSLILCHINVTFNQDNVYIDEPYNMKEYKSFKSYITKEVRTKPLNTYYEEMDYKVQGPGQNFEIVKPTVYNAFLKTYRNVIKEQQKKDKAAKDNVTNSLLSDNNSKRKIKFIYRTLRKSGHTKKNTTVLEKKIEMVKKEIGYIGNIEVIEVNYENTSLKVIDFINQDYMIFVSINNNFKQYSETVLINIKEKTDLFQIATKLRSSNLNKALGKKTDNTYNHLISLFKDTFNETFLENKNLKHFSLRYRTNSLGYNSNEVFTSLELTLHAKNLSLRLFFHIIPTDSAIEIIDMGYNHSNTLSLISKISKDTTIDEDTKSAMIEEIEEIEDNFSNFKFYKDNISLPEFKNIKQLLAWLKLKKVNIIL